MKRMLKILVALSLVATVPLSVSYSDTDTTPTPVGMNALLEVQSFAMEHPARFPESPTMPLARDYLTTKLESYGLEVVHHDYGSGVNIIGILEGTERPHDWVTVTAHYDTVAIPVNGIFGATVAGAWDDGSGVAATLELARAASQHEWANTLAFILFDEEEQGLVGSDAFVDDWAGAAWNGGNVRLTANVNLDPPGLHWPCGAPGIVMPLTVWQGRTNGEGRTLLREAVLEGVTLAGVPEGAYDFYSGSSTPVGLIAGASDNWEFATAGIPEIYLGSSTHLVVGGDVRLRTMYPLHTPTDTLETMLAYCGGNPLALADAFQVAMDVVWHALGEIDAYPGHFPVP